MEEQTETGRRPLADILEDLAKPIPKRMLEHKKMGGQRITFCPWHKTIKILDHYTGGYWWYEIKGKKITSSHILMTVRITILASDETIYREGTGIESLDTESWGDFQSNAEAQALKRACSKFGLGLSLYDKD